MTAETLRAFIGKRVRVCWETPSGEQASQMARLEEVGEIAWFAGGASGGVAVSWITSIEAAGEQREGGDEGS